MYDKGFISVDRQKAIDKLLSDTLGDSFSARSQSCLLYDGAQLSPKGGILPNDARPVFFF